MKKDFVILENLWGDRIKKEITTDNRLLSRPLKNPFPFHYGFLPNTEAPDGDPMDAICFEMFPVGYFTQSGYATHYATIEMIDNGVRDDKRIYYIRTQPSDQQIVDAAEWLSKYKPGVRILRAHRLDGRGVWAWFDDDFNLPTMEMQPY